MEDMRQNASLDPPVGFAQEDESHIQIGGATALEAVSRATTPSGPAHRIRFLVDLFAVVHREVVRTEFLRQRSERRLLVGAIVDHRTGPQASKESWPP